MTLVVLLLIVRKFIGQLCRSSLPDYFEKLRTEIRISVQNFCDWDAVFPIWPCVSLVSTVVDNQLTFDGVIVLLLVEDPNHVVNSVST